MEKVLELAKKQICEIETEIRKGALNDSPSIKASRKRKIEGILTFLMSYECNTKTTIEEVNLIWRYKEQLKMYLERYYKD